MNIFDQNPLRGQFEHWWRRALQGDNAWRPQPRRHRRPDGADSGSLPQERWYPTYRSPEREGV